MQKFSGKPKNEQELINEQDYRGFWSSKATILKFLESIEDPAMSELSHLSVD